MAFRLGELCCDCGKATSISDFAGCYKCKLFGSLQHVPSHCAYYDGPRWPVDVLIITAVPVEFRAVIKYLHPAGVSAWKEHALKSTGNLEIALFRPDDSSDTRFHVAAAQLPMMGLSAAAALSSHIIEALRPTYVVMLGIAAGFSEKTKIGDIVAADALWDYDAGKWTEKNGRQHFEPRAKPFEIDLFSISDFKEAARDGDYLEACLTKWHSIMEFTKVFEVPRVIIGPLISGAAVINARSRMKQIVHLNDIACGLDMEAYGVAQAVKTATTPIYSPRCLVFKSVCDLGYDKTDDDQAFAAFTSVMFFRRFMERYIFKKYAQACPMRRNIDGPGFTHPSSTPR